MSRKKSAAATEPVQDEAVAEVVTENVQPAVAAFAAPAATPIMSAPVATAAINSDDDVDFDFTGSSTKITLSTNSMELSMNDPKETELTATVESGDSKDVTWVVKNPQVVNTVIDGNKIKITPIACGQTNIIANAGDGTATCSVKITGEASLEEKEDEPDFDFDKDDPNTDKKEEETMDTENKVVLDAGWFATKNSGVGVAALHDNSDTLSDNELMNMFALGGYFVRRDSTAGGDVTGLSFTAKMRDPGADHSHESAESTTQAWVGIAFVPIGENAESITSVTYAKGYGKEQTLEADKNVSPLEKNVNHKDGDAAKDGLALYFDLRVLEEHASAGEYLWVKIKWNGENEEIFRVALDVAVTTEYDLLNTVEARRETYELNKDTVTETVNGKPIPDFAYRNKYRIKKVLPDRAIIQAGVFYKLAVPAEAISVVTPAKEEDEGAPDQEATETQPVPAAPVES